MVIEWRRKGGLKLDSGGVMAAAVTARRDVMVVCLQEVFKACDALIWTLCQQDVTFVGECEKNKLLLKPKRLKKRKDNAKYFLRYVRSRLFAAKQGRGSGRKKLAFADLPQHPRDFLVSLVSWRSA